MTYSHPPSILRQTKEGHRLYIEMHIGKCFCADQWQLDEESGWLFLPVAMAGFSSHCQHSTYINVNEISSFYVRLMASHKVQKTLDGMESATNETA
jgi:hypothetical protein